MHRLRTALTHHNHRERFHLVRFVMRLRRHSLELGSTFQKELSAVIGTAIPENAYAAFDYQLIRLEDALYDTFARRARRPTTPLQRTRESTDLPRTVIDIDLLIEFEQEDSTRIVLVEAKYDGAWDNDQLAKKAAWLSQLFHPKMVWANMVAPSFVLLSRRPPARIDTSGWPGWMVPDGAPLSMKMP